MELKKAEVCIGEKNFFIRELTCLKRNALLDIVGSFTFAEILKSITPLLTGLGIKLDEKDDDSIGKLVKLGLENGDIWGGLMACLTNVLGVGPQVICLSLEKLDAETEDYVTNNLTIQQEPIIIEQIIELNKLPETIKNYKALMTKIRGLAKIS